MRTGATLVRVLPNPRGGWDVREPGSTRALGHAAERDRAVLRARTLLQRGGVVQVLDHGGSLIQTYSVSDPGKGPCDPRSSLGPTPRSNISGGNISGASCQG